MSPSTIATVIILTTLFIILSSLGYALFYLLVYQNGSMRTLKALSVRAFLSMMLFLGLLLAIHLGWIVPNAPPL